MANVGTRAGGRCVELTGVGTPDDAMRVVQRPVPEPGPDEIGVAVRAAGVAFAEVKMRRGIYPGAPAFPFVPGYDFAGTVTDVGRNVEGFAVGDRVAGLSFTGSYAERVVLRPRYVAKVPHGVPDDRAAALVLNYVTAHQMLARTAKVRDGSMILVHGGGGGVGTALLDLARHRGLTAYATASAGKHDLVRRYGGVPIDYRSEDFVERMKAAGGADAVFDHVGGRHLLRSRAAAKRGGTVVGYGFAGAVGEEDERAIVRSTFLTFARMKLTPGIAARFYAIGDPPFSHRRHIRSDLERLLGLLATGEIEPHVGCVLPLADAARAHAMLEAKCAMGKIVLDVEGP